MRIAIYDPEPTACGLMAWSAHLQAGLRALGHEADLVSLTWSGKQRVSWGTEREGTQWFNRRMDAVGKFRDAGAFFAQYDGVLLSTPDVGLQDREAVKNEWAMPKYMRALELSGARFTTVLHSFMYDDKFAPFAHAIMSLPGFTGVGLAHASPSLVIPPGSALGSLTWVQIPHPYVPRNPVDAPLPPRDTAGTTGRMAHINGMHITAMTAAYGHLPPKTTVRLYGAAPVSNRACFPLEIYEVLGDPRFSYEGWREGNPEEVLRPRNWIRWRDDSVVRYDGAYVDPLVPCSTLTVHVSVLSAKESTGVTNYVQLESIDAGSLQVSTSLHWRPSFRGHIIHPLESMPSMRSIKKDPIAMRFLKKVGTATSEALDLTDEQRTEEAQYNREVLRSDHDPRIAAKAVVEALSAHS